MFLISIFPSHDFKSIAFSLSVTSSSVSRRSKILEAEARAA